MISGDDMPYDGNYDFNLEKQRAAERLRELGARSKFKPAFCSAAQNAGDHESRQGVEKPPDFSPGTGLTVLGGLNLDPDIILILGLLLILYAENSDKLLILALIYILI